MNCILILKTFHQRQNLGNALQKLACSTLCHKRRKSQINSFFPSVRSVRAWPQMQMGHSCFFPVQLHLMDLLQVSSSRGLIFGAFGFRSNGEEWISASSAAIVMPSTTHTLEIDCQAEAIFVIEKECIFRRMLDGISASTISSKFGCFSLIYPLSYESRPICTKKICWSSYNRDGLWFS